MTKKVLYIEGTTDDTNGNLRIGFNLLLRKELNGKMPRIVLGNSRQQTIDNCCNQPINNETRYLLVDSDQRVSGKHEDYILGFVRKFNDDNGKRLFDYTKENTFLMIPEVESWFLSQPEILDKYYATEKFSAYVKDKEAKDIDHPSDVIPEICRKHTDKAYHKVRDCSKLLPLLDTAKLKEGFEDFKLLIDSVKLCK